MRIEKGKGERRRRGEREEIRRKEIKRKVEDTFSILPFPQNDLLLPKRQVD